eukprot:943070-Pelagomonas_calceolata.AAC.5
MSLQEGEQENVDDSCREDGSSHSQDSLTQSEDDGSGDRSQEHEQLLSKGQHPHSAAGSHHHLAPAKAQGGGGSTHVDMPCPSGLEPSFSEKLQAMFSSWHIVLFLLQATLFGYGFGRQDPVVCQHASLSPCYILTPPLIAPWIRGCIDATFASSNPCRHNRELLVRVLARAGGQQYSHGPHLDDHLLG